MTRKRRDNTLAMAEPLPSKGEARRVAFLEAARAVFLEQGYEAASMSEIVERAGGSLATLYAQFGDKQTLFLAMLDARMTAMASAMTVELSAHSPARDGLRRIGRTVATTVLTPDSTQMYRIVLSLAPRFPDVAKAFSQRSQERVQHTLAAFLTDRVDAGELDIADTHQAAQMFLDLCRGGLHTRMMLDPGFVPARPQIHQTVDRAVDMFLNGCAMR
jgi:AcrR family transcriptional regulator